jgi:hypothetical protein
MDLLDAQRQERESWQRFRSVFSYVIAKRVRRLCGGAILILLREYVDDPPAFRKELQGQRPGFLHLVSLSPLEKLAVHHLRLAPKPRGDAASALLFAFGKFTESTT